MILTLTTFYFGGHAHMTDGKFFVFFHFLLVPTEIYTIDYFGNKVIKISEIVTFCDKPFIWILFIQHTIVMLLR